MAHCPVNWPQPDYAEPLHDARGVVAAERAAATRANRALRTPGTRGAVHIDTKRLGLGAAGY